MSVKHGNFIFFFFFQLTQRLGGGRYKLRFFGTVVSCLEPHKKHLECKIVIVFLPMNLNMCFGAQKNHLIEMVLLSTNNICFG